MKWNLTASLIICLAASICNAGRDPGFVIPDRVDCTDTLIIVARGTSEPPGEGPQHVIAEEVQRRLGAHRVKHIPLEWPASLFPTYGESVKTGTENLKKTISKYTSECPDIKIVLMGFSQGAQVISDTLCGMDEKNFPKTEPIDPSLGAFVAAAVGMGDPTFNPGLSYDYGTATHHGWFPRRNDKSCVAYDYIRISYCDKGDIYCDHGVDPKVHSSYFKTYFEHCVEFIIDRVKAR
ncbi:acetylxylan esterase [Nannizzia gypsea CBS 118893]|uniref:Acetylxylan esterase n=1 Tax=Arthroderma gypseum (strain ATCC MYA-4604 / CBS 118893) TaxID=535722 RepID=E4V6T4_ARTGP|nr:acetylxylan esterase [Nannizzia gypsea CBS 118893]EFQ96800.1 acetylxylan esterase [Nannizzia gypsea CBS 118893]